MTTINYEAIEGEEILFQPQGMTVEYVAKSNKEINNDECERLSYAIKIQALWRGYVCRKDYIPLGENCDMTDDDYAMKIQALWRGYVCRKNMKKEKVEDKPKYTYNAIVEKHDKDRPTNFEIIMMMCNL